MGCLFEMARDGLAQIGFPTRHLSKNVAPSREISTRIIFRGIRRIPRVRQHFRSPRIPRMFSGSGLREFLDQMVRESPDPQNQSPEFEPDPSGLAPEVNVRSRTVICASDAKPSSTILGFPRRLGVCERHRSHSTSPRDTILAHSGSSPAIVRLRKHGRSSVRAEKVRCFEAVDLKG